MEQPPAGYRIGLWIAVSSRPQANPEKESLPEQRRLGEAFAQDVGGQVVRTYEIPGLSRDYVLWDEAQDAVPQYRWLREDLEAGRLDVLWCYDTDRLGRTAALIQQVLGLAARNGCEVYISTAPHQLGHASGAQRIVAAIKGSLAEQDQELRVTRHRMGMRGRVVRRGLLPSNLPFYLDPVRDERGEIVRYALNERLPTLATMTRLFLDGYSIAEIMRKLKREGHPPPPGARRWYDGSIWRMLNSDVPAGYAQWGPYRSSEPSPHIEAAWDAGTHRAVVQERQRRRQTGYIRRGAGPLTRVAYCNRCGWAMVRGNITGGGRQLRCGSHLHQSRYPEWACHPNLVFEADVLAYLTDWLRDIADPADQEAFLAELEDRPQEAGLRRDLAAASANIDGYKDQRRRLGHALASGAMDLDLYRQVDGEIRTKLDAEELRWQELRIAIEALPDIEQYRAILGELTANLDYYMAQAEPTVVARALQEAGIRVLVEDSQPIEVVVT